MNEGKYILIEGGEGSGKSTQVNLLGEYFNKKRIPFVRTYEPGGTDLSREFERIVKTKGREDLTYQAELFSFLAARSQVITHVIKPNLGRGNWVISDRGYPSTFAYQCCGRGIEFGIIDLFNEFSTTVDGIIISPDIIFVIDVPEEVGLKKVIERSGETDRIESEGSNFHRFVNEGYRIFLERYPKISVKIPYIEDDPLKMNNQIIRKLEERFGMFEI